MSLATIFKKHELEATAHLYQPETDSGATRQLVKIRNEIYLDDEICCRHQMMIANQIDGILKYIDSVDMEMPRYGV